MANLETYYAGLKLKNPLVVGSSGLTNKVQGVEKAAESGVGAVVLKSLFEEQLKKDSLQDSSLTSAEGYDYLLAYGSHEYLKLVEDSKKSVDIPVIASLNCYSKEGWLEYAKEIAGAGADAIELNIMILPEKEIKDTVLFQEGFYKQYPVKPSVEHEKFPSAMDIEDSMIDTISEVNKKLAIPVTVKLSSAFTSLPHFANRLNQIGTKGLVLFNNFYTPDFDIHSGEVLRNIKLSSPEQAYNTLRWINLLDDEVGYDLSASTGIHSYESCIKMIMAGAATVQLCSVLYKDGYKIVDEYLGNIAKWMDEKGYQNISSFKGTLDQFLDKKIFTRLQYMKLSNGYE